MPTVDEAERNWRLACYAITRSHIKSFGFTDAQKEDIRRAKDLAEAELFRARAAELERKASAR